MKKLTELDLQISLDECELIKFQSHGEWLAGMVNRLNKTITSDEPATFVGNAILRKKPAVLIPPIKTIIRSGNVTEPTVPCIS